ncbi:MAG: alpha/beta hydrolase [Bacteroidota bacterium]
MKKKYAILFFATFLFQSAFTQELVLKKGKIIDSLVVNDTIPDTFSLYLPTNFTTTKKWPLLMVFDLDGKERQSMAMFLQAAEEEGYLLAAPKLSDTVPLSNNMISASNVLNKISRILPVNKSRVYTAGISSGGRFANLVPIFIKDVAGTISAGASIANSDLLNPKRSFHFIGIIGKNDFNYTQMLNVEKVFDRFKFPNQILLYDEEQKWPDVKYFQKAMQLFTLSAMGKKLTPMDSSYIEKAFKEDLAKVNRLKNSNKLLFAEQYMGEMMSIYGVHKNLDSLRQVQKNLRRDRVFKGMRRAENATFFKESLLKEDYQYYIEEDVVTHNFNNLGWWNYQMTEINKFISASSIYERQMGNRLLGYVNALAEDNIDMVKSEPLIDEDALAFLYMLKTILEPENFEHYMNIISLSAKNEDYGTALFYLEEALKKGFDDKEKLYNLPDTGLFRITPKFNELVAKYLKDSRYRINDQ